MTMTATSTDATTTTATPTGKQRRGFASMTPEARKRIASLGGKAAHAQGKAHEWTAIEASAAGRKGGAAKHANKATAAPEAGTGQDITRCAEAADLQTADQPVEPVTA